MGGAARVMVATNAFGLGIDKADTRFVCTTDAGRPRCLLPGVGPRRPRRARRPTAPCSSCTATRRSSSSSSPAAIRRKEDVADLYARVAPHAGGRRRVDARDAAGGARPAEEQGAGRAAAAAPPRVVDPGPRGPTDAAPPASTADALEKLAAVATAQARKRPGDARADGLLRPDRALPLEGRCSRNFGEDEGFERCGACDNCVRIAAAFAAAEREREGEALDANPVDGEAPDVDRAQPARLTAAVIAPPAAAPLPERGEIVTVPRYGRGIVDAVDAEGITVVFPEGSRRVFLAAFVRLRPAPRGRSSRAAKVTASAA